MKKGDRLNLLLCFNDYRFTFGELRFANPPYVGYFLRSSLRQSLFVSRRRRRWFTQIE